MSMTTAEEFFDALLFGNGAWLGLTLILGLLFVISLKEKYFGLIGAVTALFLGIQYFNNVATSENLMWCGILCFVSIPFFFVVSLRGRYDI